jgi:hypothetical protein
MLRSMKNFEIAALGVIRGGWYGVGKMKIILNE